MRGVGVVVCCFKGTRPGASALLPCTLPSHSDPARSPESKGNKEGQEQRSHQPSNQGGKGVRQASSKRKKKPKQTNKQTNKKTNKQKKKKQKKKKTKKKKKKKTTAPVALLEAPQIQQWRQACVRVRACACVCVCYERTSIDDSSSCAFFKRCSVSGTIILHSSSTSY